MRPAPDFARPRDSDNPVHVVSVQWEMFAAWFRDAWQTGEHVALIGPTGQGKSTFAVGILKSRKYVLALDPKGEDSTLTASGFERIFSWPLSSKMRDRIAEGKPARLLVGGSVDTDADQDKLVALMEKVLAGVRAEGRWTVYADEFQLLADRRMYGLDKQVERMLIAARSKGTSVVTSFQAPAWVPKAATRQASWCVIFPTRDINMIKAVGETMGRPWQELVAAVRELPRYHALVIPAEVHSPMVLTKAPKVG